MELRQACLEGVDLWKPSVCVVGWVGRTWCKLALCLYWGMERGTVPACSFVPGEVLKHTLPLQTSSEISK